MDYPTIARLHCNICGGVTRHQRLHEHRRTVNEPEDDPVVWYDSDYELFECLGCESAVLRVTSRFSEDDPERADDRALPAEGVPAASVLGLGCR